MDRLTDKLTEDRLTNCLTNQLIRLLEYRLYSSYHILFVIFRKEHREKEQRQKRTRTQLL